MLPSRCPDSKFVVIRVGKLRPFAPGLGGEFLGQPDPTSFEHCARFFNVVGMQNKASHACFITGMTGRAGRG